MRCRNVQLIRDTDGNLTNRCATAGIVTNKWPSIPGPGLDQNPWQEETGETVLEDDGDSLYIDNA
jgi:hypothetical protein